MKNEELKKASGYIKTHRFQKRWQKVVTGLAAVVVFCTTYALILPAITMEKEPCQIPEHTHSEACYTQTASGSEAVHAHSESCYTMERGGLTCTVEESGGHTHSVEAGCYGKALVCQTEESEGHTHSVEAGCFDENGELTCQTEESEGHSHSVEAGCFDENRELTCQTEESEGHQHTDDCYAWNEVLTCELPTEAAEELTCQLEENEEHQHSALCYGTWELTCGLEEHTHTAECNLPVELTEEEHAQVEEVIALIDALPTQQEIDETLAAFEDDKDGCDAYLMETAAQARAAYQAWSALTEAQQEQVTNTEKLLALEPLWSAATLESTPLMGDDAYISGLAMGTTDQDTGNGITDGSVPWDDSEGDGLDTGAHNKRVRTFDTVKYDFYYTTGLQDENSTEHYTSARVYFEFLLPVERSQAVFSVEDMSWLKTSGTSYAYEEEMAEIDGKSYQVLHGSFLDDRETLDITAASRSRDVTIRVLNMKNGDTIQPVFSVWMEYNDVGLDYQNNIPVGTAYNNGHTCSNHDKPEVTSLLPDAVTVTCTPRYDITFARGEAASTSWSGSFDFSTGNGSALDKADETWNGRINAYGIRVMVKGLDKEHGLRGCAFPEPGDTLEFDITLTTSWKSSVGENDEQYITQEFMPRVWSAEEFSNADTQKDGRKVNLTKLPSYAAPLNQGDNPAESCYDGGSWTFTDRAFEEKDGKTQRVIHVTVSDYTFDPTHLPYTHERGTEKDAEFYNPEEVGSQYWKIQNAVFSTGEMWVVTPFYDAPGTDSDHYITKVKETDSLTMGQDIFAYDMEVKDSNKTTKYKEDGQLYSLNAAITLQNPGNFTAEVFALNPANEWDKPLTAGCFEGENALKDYATPGSYVDLEAVLVHDWAEDDAVGVAYNLMVKFDNACFEPVTWKAVRPAGYPDSKGDSNPWNGFKHDLNMEDFPYVGHAWTVWPDYTLVPDYQNNWNARGAKMLYGTVNGGTGWNHSGLKPDQAGYDAQMMQATPDDLTWYDSMEELKAAGAECVAVLMEYRNVGNDGNNPGASTMNHLHMAVHGKIKDTVEPGYVYAISNYATVWTKADVREYVTDVTNDGQIGTMDYLYYTQHNFPSYSPSASNKMDSSTFPTPTQEQSWNRCTNVSEENVYQTLEKSRVDENGSFISGTGGYFYQDNVYVVSYKSETGIQVAQTDEAGVSKSNYNLDTNERVVDFKITPSFTRSATDTGAGGTTQTMYADATVTVTLPQGLEYHSAVWGGEYTQDSTCQSPGTVTGGEPLDTRVVTNEDGTTTLTWVLENIPLSSAAENLAPIYFSCKIGNSADLTQDVESGQKLDVQTDIYSTADPGVIHGPAYNNQAKTQISVTKSNNVTIIKKTDQPVVDMGQDMGFTMRLYNGSDSEYSGWIADILPYNGEGKSSFHGQLQIGEFQVVTTDEAWKGVTFYYTTDTQYRGSTNITNLDTSGWSTFQLDDNYKWSPPAETGQITAIAYQYSIPAKGSIRMHITLSLPDSQAGDVIYNRLLLNNLVSNDSCLVASRTLEGLTWMDDNGNGIQDEKEDRRLSGVKVELLKLKEDSSADPKKEEDYEPYHYQNNPDLPVVEIETGQQISVRAGSVSDATNYGTGQYKFTDLPAGTFAVRFTDGSGKIKISTLLASPENRGTNDTLDSDGAVTYSPDHSRLEKTVILGIDMPKVEDMSGPLKESKHNDSGFYERGHELPMTGGPGTTVYTIGGTLLIAGAALLLLYRNKKRRKEDFASS